MQNTRLVLCITIVFFAVLNLWLLRPRSQLSVVLAACLAQVGFVTYIFLVRVPDTRTTLPLTLHFAPDLGQMTLVLVLLAGWSVVRAVVAVAQQGRRKDEGPVIAG